MVFLATFFFAMMNYRRKDFQCVSGGTSSFITQGERGNCATPRNVIGM